MASIIMNKYDVGDSIIIIELYGDVSENGVKITKGIGNIHTIERITIEKDKEIRYGLNNGLGVTADKIDSYKYISYIYTPMVLFSSYEKAHEFSRNIENGNVIVESDKTIIIKDGGR